MIGNGSAFRSITILIAFLSGAFVYRNWNQNTMASELVYNKIVVPNGAKSQLILSDGTEVWLNAGSTFRYPNNFLAKTREVYLEGEAYFDVAHNQDKLFVVKTSDIDVKVYGTKFNVKAYPDENNIKTTLVSGKVAIEPTGTKSPQKSIYLTPNESVTFYKKTASLLHDSDTINSQAKKIKPKRIVIERKADPLPIISWKDTTWIIDGEELEKLAVKLERKFNVEIKFEDESLKSYKFSGTLIEETFEQVMKIIQISAPITYSINNNQVLITVDNKYKREYDKMLIPTN